MPRRMEPDDAGSHSQYSKDTIIHPKIDTCKIGLKAKLGVVPACNQGPVPWANWTGLVNEALIPCTVSSMAWSWNPDWGSEGLKKGQTCRHMYSKARISQAQMGKEEQGFSSSVKKDAVDAEMAGTASTSFSIHKPRLTSQQRQDVASSRGNEKRLTRVSTR
ncbi:hypothetical protein STEG23_029841 [Scotinomys teguina]